MSEIKEVDSKSRIKVVFLGDRAVGKSSIINRFITSQFEDNLQPTVGVDYLGKNIQYKKNDYRIELWDTAGQQKFRSLVKGYLRGTDVCVFVYDCSNLNSYLSLPEWLGLFDSVASPDALKLIVGNKCDKKHEKQQLDQTKQALREDNEELGKIPELMASAKLGINIEQIFESVVEMWTNSKITKQQKSISLGNMISSLQQKSKVKCCQ